MPTLAKRVVGALLAVLGLVLTVIGLWYAVHLGGSGTATFSAPTTGTSPVLVPQTVLNRVDGVVTVTAVPRSGGTAWLAAATPSDAKAVLGKTAHMSITGVSTRPWELLSTTAGSGQPPALADSDVWRNTTSGKGAVTMKIEQADAPETVIAHATQGQLERIEVSWERKSWFVQSVIAALVGLFLLLSGLSLLWSSRRGKAATRPGGTRGSADTRGTAGTRGTTGTRGTRSATAAPPVPAIRKEENV
ncbi:hypothetical protein N802_02125 [Knoellia sinensis KCTC 19936]|uniref:Uncharacterized protein n=1 Tax=Knoellia sinensis KCTC 19936 TaxID=1385520 RepID=A0A0A0JD39_9MICO|nr:hypothetical protein [Knoellia sinensis]KGN35048.1 hypothetical protein N802_02125 [Knoellia sinensis KCTC 19936]